MSCFGGMRSSLIFLSSLTVLGSSLVEHVFFSASLIDAHLDAVEKFLHMLFGRARLNHALLELSLV